MLVAVNEADPAVGSVCGKLLGMSSDLTIPKEPILDSTGIVFTPNLRHFDRGSQVPDNGQYEQAEYVFGATGAACLYRRKMMDDIAINGEYLLDSDFFAYREDADLAWRAQLLGWKCFYTPKAVAYHVRHVLPDKRAALPALINMHSVKNRWLMRIKNITGDLYARHFVAITIRDCMVIAGCLLRGTLFVGRLCAIAGAFVGKDLGEAPRHHAEAARFERIHGQLVHGQKLMRIALLGTRGIPANYGGFETFAEELSVRLVERGHEVTVYCREPCAQQEYRGVKLRYLPAIRHKYFETIAHTGISTVDALFHRFDVLLYCNAANAVFTLWPRLLGMPTALNVDGVERRRKKWNIVAKIVVSDVGVVGDVVLFFGDYRRGKDSRILS